MALSLSSSIISGFVSMILTSPALAAQRRPEKFIHDDESHSTAADAVPESGVHVSPAVGEDHNTSRLVFVLDSAASFHVTGNRSFLAAAFVVLSALLYRARDGRDLLVAGAGTLSCQGFHIPGVRYVPALGAGVTLVSVQQLAACGYLVAFGGGACYVKDPGSGSLLGKGHLNEDDGLYHLEFLKIPAGAGVDRTSGSTAA